MSNLKIKPIVLLIACLCLLMTLSCISANEIDNVAAIDDAVSSGALSSPLGNLADGSLAISSSSVDDEGAAEKDAETGGESFDDSTDDELIENNTETGIASFSDLIGELENLEGNGYYNIDRDYVFNEETDIGNSIININVSYLTIYGNRHTIDANGSDLAKFIVNGNNVIIYDLIFKNFNGNEQAGNIQWNGNNGHLTSCDFYNNTAQNGGAIAWNGNNGYIKYCLFENNTALNHGGAIYVTGESNSIESNTFRNSISPLADEAIYFSSKKGQVLDIKNCEFFNNDSSINSIKALYDDGCIVLYNGVDLSYESFDILCNEIENLKSGDYYILERDYVVSNTKGNIARDRIINILADNVTIDGNGHTINGGGAREFFGLFNITGNNVRILNLNILNFRAYDSDYINSIKNIYGNDYNHLTSPIEWHGDNGFISNCIFNDTVGDFGGAIYWSGSNGMIENCVFDDNAADFGGAIYIAGNNSLIKDSIFNNPYTSNKGEAICLKNNAVLTLNNCTFISERLISKAVDAENGCEVIYEGIIPKNTFPPMSFKNLIELLQELKDGDTFNFDRDCYFEIFDGDLTINASNITINGNGYKIYGADTLSCLFNICGDNVKIIGLTFDFTSLRYSCSSFISLIGNNGKLINCTFIGSAAKTVGVVNWNGDNGIIDNCAFINNSAFAIYMDGTDNIISNCIFNNTFSPSINGAIYYIYKNLDKQGFLAIDNCSFENEIGAKIWIDDSSEVMIDGKSVPVTIDDLFDEISNLKAGELYDICRNYYSPSKSCIINQDNITLNANGHGLYVYEGTLNESIFFVEGNNVNFNGLSIYDKDDLRNGSLITWTGDNGILTNCALIGNLAEFGGAISWSGNNGLIDGNEFENNSAVYAGGSIFINGNYNIIRNCIFTSSGSKLCDEAIYIDRSREGIALENLIFENSQAFIDGYASGFDLDYLTKYHFDSWAADECFNIYPMIYAVFMVGGVHFYNNYTYYYGSYDDKNGEFSLTYVKDLPEFDTRYSKTFIFKNIFNYSIGTIFDELSEGNYQNKFNIAKTAFVNNESDYLNVMQNTFYFAQFLNPIMDIFSNDLENSNWVLYDFVNYTLNVVFTKTLVINSDKTWDLSSSAFSSLNIDGCGSIIRGSFEDRDEDKWVTLGSEKVFSASNIILQGFNTAVENTGGMSVFINVTFDSNKMDYWVDRDWGAAMLNTGLVYCMDCTFKNNYAKNGGAIFNQGLLVMDDCIFSGNEAYGVGSDICVGDGGQVILEGENITKDNQYGPVYFAEDISVAEETLLGILCGASSFLIGAVVGFVTANPVLGVAAGVAAGAAIGAVGAAYDISGHYDVNYDRVLVSVLFIVGSAISGAAGGYVGSVIAAAVTRAGMVGSPLIAHETPLNQFIVVDYQA